MESVVISGMVLPFSELWFPQKPGGLQSSPIFQSTYRPNMTAGALLRSHNGRVDRVCEDMGGCMARANRMVMMAFLFM
jgi:hypothetical protein